MTRGTIIVQGPALREARWLTGDPLILRNGIIRPLLSEERPGAYDLVGVAVEDRDGQHGGDLMPGRMYADREDYLRANLGPIEE